MEDSRRDGSSTSDQRMPSARELSEAAFKVTLFPQKITISGDILLRHMGSPSARSVGVTDTSPTPRTISPPSLWRCVNVHNAAITSTIVQPKQGNALEPSTTPESKGGFVKNRTDADTNLAVNFHFMPYGQDSMNNMEITQCESKVWIARKLQKFCTYTWDPRNNIGHVHHGGNACTLLIATVTQCDPRYQFRMVVSLRNIEANRDNVRLVDLMVTPKRGIGNFPGMTPLKAKKLNAHYRNVLRTTWYVNNVPLWQAYNKMGLRLINNTKYTNDKVTEQLVSDTFYKVDRRLRDVYSYPEAPPDVKAAMGERLTPRDPDHVRQKRQGSRRWKSPVEVQ